MWRDSTPMPVSSTPNTPRAPSSVQESVTTPPSGV
jgi:hypothetical protein